MGYPYYQYINYYRELNELVKSELKVNHVDVLMSEFYEYTLNKENIIKAHFLIQEMGHDYSSPFSLPMFEWGRISSYPAPANLVIETKNEFRILKNLAYNAFFNRSMHFDKNCIEISKAIRHKNEPTPKKMMDDITYFDKEFGQYPPLLQTRFKYNQFVISTMNPYYQYEGDRKNNRPNHELLTSLSMKNGLLYGNIDEHGFEILNSDKDHNNIWILDKYGKLFAVNIDNTFYHHSYFIKKNGYGLPIAAGGHFNVKQGKIIHIDNYSGHYLPNEDQLLLAAHYLYEQNVLAHDVVVESREGHHYSLNDIQALDVNAILAKYRELEQ